MPVVISGSDDPSTKKKSPSSGNINRLPLLATTKPSERLELFARKLHACCNRYDFTNEESNVKEKEIKFIYLKEIIEFFDKMQGVLAHETIYALSAVMISKNIFRYFPPKEPNYDPDEDDAIMDPAWPHLELVYEYFLLFIGSDEFQPSIAKKYIDARFVTRLLYTFASDDVREREVLKGILHRIYGKFLGLRATIRRQINNIFLGFLYDGLEFSGIAEILEILGSIINGYVCPLKPEHTTFLNKILIPLHSSKDLTYFQPQLVYCIVQYLEKDASMTTTIVKGILKFWPRTSMSKAVLLLGELEELIDVMQPAEYNAVQNTILKHLASCIRNSHFQVAERALYFFDNEYFMSLLEVKAKETFPIVLPNLAKVAVSHWNTSISDLAKNVLTSLEEANSEAYHSIISPRKDTGDNKKQKKRKSLWEMAVKLTLRKR